MWIKLMLMLCSVIPLGLSAQGYQSMWNEVEQARKRDLPQSALSALERIASKAEKGKDYGQLLKAESMAMEVAYSIAPDSLAPRVERMETLAEREQKGNVALASVLDAVLGYVIAGHDSEAEAGMSSDEHYARAMSHADVLGATSSGKMDPMVEHGVDSKIFNDDLLHVIGMLTHDYATMAAYYNKVGNRRAECLSLLWGLMRSEEWGVRSENTFGNEDKQSISHSSFPTPHSSLSRFSDLDVYGEVVVENYHRQHDMTTEQRYQYINVALEKWGNWKRMNELRNEKLIMTQPSVNLELHGNEPDAALLVEEANTGYIRPARPMKVSVRNTKSLTVRLWKLQVEGDTRLSVNDKDERKQLLHGAKELTDKTVHRTYDIKQPYETIEDSIALPALPPGVYMIEAEADGAKEHDYRLYFVSRLTYLAEEQPDEMVRLAVVDRITGQPVPQAKVEILRNRYRRDKTPAQTFDLDEQGEMSAKLDSRYPNEIFITTENDRGFRLQQLSADYRYHEARETAKHVEIFTDRRIYRPGQTVKASAVAFFTQKGEYTFVQPQEKITFRLTSANGQTVGEQTQTTDEMGVASVEFQLPTSGLTGNYTLRASVSPGQAVSQIIRVDEYKRPTFEVEMESPTRSERLPQPGDTITVEGKALSYSGMPVEQASVVYRVVRRRAWWCWWSRHSDEVEILSDTTVTDADGRFTVRMPLTLPNDDERGFYRFEVEATVTDMAGESHSGVYSVTLGRRRAAVKSDLSEKLNADEQNAVTLMVVNALGENVDTDVRWRIDGGSWRSGKSGEKQQLPSLKSGRHLLEAESEGDTLRQEFLVFHLDDTKPCETTDEWFYVSSKTFPRDGGSVTVQVGSSDEDVHILYGIFSGKKTIESGVIDQSNRLINRKFKYKEEYGNGLLLTFAWVKNGKAHCLATTIAKPLPDKELKMKWTTFRDRLEPGQTEQWELQVSKPDGTPCEAHVIATLFDKSLDQLQPHNWSVSLGLGLPLPNTRWTSARALWMRLALSGEYSPLQTKALDWSQLVLPQFYRRMRFKGGRVLGTRMAKAEAKYTMASVNDMELNAVGDVAVMASAMPMETDDSAEETSEPPTVEMRENFTETAFFEPGLMTDKQGRAVLRFTLPESVTTWRFMGLAHDKEMCYGKLESEAVAQKKLMVKPNIPRFLRHGDEATLITRIANLGDSDDKGDAWIELIDPETEKTLFSQKQPFSVEKGRTTSASFRIGSLEGLPSLVICRISAKGESHSDGEQHWIALLPETERVTVTVPFTQNNPGKKEISLAELFPEGVSDRRLTIEYTNHPAWLMIQAMPSMGIPTNNNAVSLAASLYTNSLAQTMIKQSKRAKSVFEQWRMEKGEETSLMSQLEKNEELKTLVLDETPWVMEATRESEQKRQLGIFFEPNAIDQRIDRTLNKLKALQSADGSWRWWPGMSGSLYITVDIAEMLVKLNQMTGQQQYEDMLRPAFSYMGKEIKRRVDEMKRWEKKGHNVSFPSLTALQWLYLCKIDGRKLPNDVAQANAWLIGLLKKDIKSQSIYDKALTAIILDSKEYVKSLKEYTVYREEMGRYYDSPRAFYSWKDYRIPTQVAAIEAIKRITPKDTTTISEMQRWLLQEKRTQAWDTPINSVNAIYAFLYNNMSVLDAAEDAHLSIDGTPLSASTTAGTGYVKQVVDMSSQPKTFTADKRSEGISWGAVYAQFSQHSTEIEAHEAGISVKREIISPNPTLKVGDRVKVRLTIRSERDLDFVEIVDRRPACLEPVNQLSTYDWGYYITPRDCSTNYYFDQLPKGKRVIETEYYVDRVGTYESGTVTAGCAYAPEFRATAPAYELRVEN